MSSVFLLTFAIVQLAGIRCTSAPIGLYLVMLTRLAMVILGVKALSLAPFSISSSDSFALVFLIFSLIVPIIIKRTKRVGFTVLVRCLPLAHAPVLRWVACYSDTTRANICFVRLRSY